jgi:hypothetical protein
VCGKSMALQRHLYTQQEASESPYIAAAAKRGAAAVLSTARVSALVSCKWSKRFNEPDGSMHSANSQ